MKYTITGDNLQFVNVELQPDEEFRSVGGAMAYMTGNMRMDTNMEGGFMKSLKRSLSGATMFMVKYMPQGGVGIVGLSGKAPGKVIDLDISKGSWFVQSSGYLGSEMGVDLELAIQKKLSTAMFGGEGLAMQKLTGNGIAFVHACGDMNIVELKEGEMYKVSSPKVVAWEESVKYDFTTVGGVKNALFSGEGLFVTTLTGPGKIITQSMTLGELAMALYPYMPQSSS